MACAGAVVATRDGHIFRTLSQNPTLVKFLNTRLVSSSKVSVSVSVYLGNSIIDRLHMHFYLQSSKTCDRRLVNKLWWRPDCDQVCWI